ncbi:hypothetical protein EYF80_061656 [Liparis tanakae]|uniref:Uncharacterized protein n=1 Tax=Liparis tanakae TaxID=230148 RepID=A0A4Z2EH59_9TELE|nr:hypothetical protein EYF80_061656 [Liparis tanakae]
MKRFLVGLRAASTEEGTHLHSIRSTHTNTPVACWVAASRPYRCRLATTSTSTATRTALHRKLCRWPLPATVALPPQPGPPPRVLSPAGRLSSSRSPMLRRRDASSRVAEHRAARRPLQEEPPGGGGGGSAGGGHMFRGEDTASVPLVWRTKEVQWLTPRSFPRGMQWLTPRSFPEEMQWLTPRSPLSGWL